MPTDFKPAKRVRDSRAGVEKVRAESHCRACGLVSKWVKDGGVLNRAHLLNRSQGGDDLDACIVPLCGSGSLGCHAAFDSGTQSATWPSLLAESPWSERCTRAIRQIVKNSLTESEREYLIWKKGEYWLEHLFAGPAKTEQRKDYL